MCTKNRNRQITAATLSVPSMSNLTVLRPARSAPGSRLQPTDVRIANIDAGALNYNLISTEGQMVRRVREPSREVLLLQDGAAIVLAELDQPAASSSLGNIEEGSRVRVVGISVLEVEWTWNYGASDERIIRSASLAAM